MPVLSRLFQALPFFSALLVLLALGSLALDFYRERMLNFDPAFFSFLMLDDESFYAVLGRYGTWPSQLPAVLGIPLNLSLPALLKLYSVSFVALYLLYLLIIQKLRDTEAVFLLPLALTLSFRDTFYYSTAELYQGIALSIVMWSFFKRGLDNSGRNAQIWLIATSLLLVWISFYHQLTLFSAFFLLGLEYLRRREWLNRKAIALMLWCIIWFGFRIKFLSFSSYEKERLMGVSGFMDGLANFTELPTTRYFLHFMQLHGWFLIMVLVGGVILLAFQRKWLITAYTVISLAGYTMIILLGLRHESNPIMLQNYYAMFGLFLGIPLATGIKGNKPVLISALILLLGGTGIYLIRESSADLRARTRYAQNLVEYGRQIPGEKFVLEASRFPWSYGWTTWALPFETLLHSAENPGEQLSWFVSAETDTLQPYLHDPNSFFGPDWDPQWFRSNGFNRRFFKLENGPYRLMNSPQEQNLPSDSLFDSGTIKSHSTPFHILTGKDRHYREILIYNNSDRLLPSVEKVSEGLWVYAVVEDSTGNALNYQLHSLQVDILPGASCKMLLPYPATLENHSAELKFGFLLKTDGKERYIHHGEFTLGE